MNTSFVPAWAAARYAPAVATGSVGRDTMTLGLRVIAFSMSETCWAGSKSASVLDTTVRAAAAIAEHYLQRGDRVSLLEYGSAARRLRPATGRRQYLRVLEWLLDVRPDPVEWEQEENVFGVHHVSSDALVMVLTPLIDPRAADLLARLTQSGRYVVAVDTLPAGARPENRNPWTPLATRLWRIERENVLGRLREHGVPVVAWAGAGSLDLVLRDVSRLASVPRGR